MSSICINRKLYLNANNVNITIYNSDNIDITERIYNRDKKLIIDENIFCEKFSYNSKDDNILRNLIEEYLSDNVGTYLLDIDELDRTIDENDSIYEELSDIDIDILKKLKELVKHHKTMLHNYNVHYEYEIYNY